MTNEASSEEHLVPKKHVAVRYATITLGVLIVVLGGSFAAYHFLGGGGDDKAAASNTGPKRPAGQSQPVSVAEAAIKDVRLWLPAIGTATPRNLVTIHSRVDGELLRVHFKEGDTVQQGQLLAELDPRTYQAQLTQVKGQLTRDQALLRNARLDLERYQELWSKDSISKQILDTQTALVHQYEGTVENDKGLVDNASLQVSFTRITAPVSGRISLRQVDPGNQVHASDANGLASIAQMEPMTVVFAAPETRLPEISRRLGEGPALVTEAWDREQKTQLAVGRLLTTDNQIDPTTGTIKLKAEFANADHMLFPSQFVNIRLLLGIQKNAMVIPSSAIMRGAKGTFVYVVDGEAAVKSVPVTPGAVDGDLTAISGEIKAGDRVVTDGGDKLRDGAKVEMITREQAKTTGAEQGKARRGRQNAPKDGEAKDSGQGKAAS